MAKILALEILRQRPQIRHSNPSVAAADIESEDVPMVEAPATPLPATLLEDAPVASRGIRVQTPERKPAIKRSKNTGVVQTM